MYNWDSDYRDLRPSEKALAACVKVEFDGEGRFIGQMRRWCRETGCTVAWVDRTDMSDSSYWTGPDDYVIFYFFTPEDATLFRLKWL